MATWTVDEPTRITCDEDVHRLDVSLIAGQVTVVGTDGPPRVEIAKVGTKPVHVEVSGGVLRVRQEALRSWGSMVWWLRQIGRRGAVDVSIAVPPTVRASLGMIAGKVIASGLRERTDVDVTSGSITLMGVGGHTRVNLVAGPVEALGVAGELIMETVSGELILADSPATRVRATAVSGSITCDLAGPEGGDISLETTSGSITARVREDSDLTVRLSATAGRVTSAFPQLRAERNMIGGATIAGVLGRGGGRLQASAMSGSIALLSRPPIGEDDQARAGSGATEGGAA